MRMSSKALIINLKLDKSLSGWQTDPLQGGKQYRPRGHQHLRGSKQTKSRFQPYFKPVPSVAAGSAAQLSAPLALQQACTLQINTSSASVLLIR